MNITKVKKIIIFGGGTSGWLTAAYLSNNLKIKTDIVLIESLDIGPIGVGEGTQPGTARFLYDCGIDPYEWMKPSNASFKLGVEFVDWTEKNYFVDNDFIENTVISPDLYTIDYFIGKDKHEFADWLPAYQLAKANKSPKLAGLDTNFAHTGIRQFGAVHFDAYQILEAIKSKIANNITSVNTKIVKINSDDHGISGLVDETGKEYNADLYIDCTGFASLLTDKTLKIPFHSVNDILPCDKAVVMPTEYSDPVNECRPLTTATAMSAGWMFTIPVFHRQGNGYVYSSKHISPDQAEQELRNKINKHDGTARHLNMRCGIHDSVAHKNVMTVGLSAGFVEPLEATGITFTTKAVELLTEGLNLTNNMWSDPVKKEINRLYDNMFWEIAAFIWCHYKYSNKLDTDFWQDVRNKDIKDLPKKAQSIIENFIPKLKRDFLLSGVSIFHLGQWFSVLNASGLYDSEPKRLSGDLEKYADFFIKNQNYRVDLIKDMFPNHYEFLKEWYS